jgi:hypothetical protein
MPLPHAYSELYPGRFLKADLLKGRKVTLTIKDINIEELIGENNKKDPKVIVSFTERPLELVFPKTNGECLRRMFGGDPHNAIGKRITLFPSTTKFGRETVDCIRIWGSPDLAEDMNITVPQGRKKALEMVMHKVNPGECGFKGDGPVTPPVDDPDKPLHPSAVVCDALSKWDGLEGRKRRFIEHHANKSDLQLIQLIEAEIIDDEAKAEEAAAKGGK